METQWRQTFEEARRRWPEVGLGYDVFRQHLIAHGWEQAPSPHAEELYLACACASGDEAAVRCMEAGYFGPLRAVVKRFDGRDQFTHEVLQLLRHKLFTGTPPKIASYTGRGPLPGWLRVAAGRTALDHQRSLRRQPQETLARELVALDDTPENRAFWRAYAGVFQAALSAVLAALSARERNVLRLHFKEQMNIDAIGRIYGVHRATVARWIAACREQVFDGVRARLRQQLGTLSGSEFASMVRTMHERLDISLSAVLGRGLEGLETPDD